MNWEIKTTGNDFEVIKKPCSKCKQEKPLSAYAINNSTKDGLMRFCRQCNSDMRSKKPKRKPKAGVKQCYRCKMTKTYSEFCINKRKPDGYNHKCKSCDKIERDAREVFKDLYF